MANKKRKLSITKNASYKEASQRVEELLVQLKKELTSEQYEKIENQAKYNAIISALAAVIYREMRKKA